MQDAATARKGQVPAGKGRAVRLSAGQAIKIINTHGHQVCDTWIFSAEDMTEFMSMPHLHATLESIFAKVGDGLITNRRRAIATLEEDTSPGRHDTVMAACDDYRYGLLGCTEFHDNCTDNLHAALRQIGLKSEQTPSPMNIFMNIPVAEDGKTGWGEPLSKPGDYVVIRALMDCVVAMSSCPQDILPINRGKVVELDYEILN